MAQALSVPAPNTDELADEEIVRRVRAGDSALYEILMRRHNQRLYRTIRAILRDDREVEDVMQQAYLNAYLHLDQFKGTARFSTWLTRIAVNQAIRRGRTADHRHEAITASDSDDVFIDHVQAPGLDPEHTMYGQELKGVIEGVLESLPEPYRLVFVLREVEGLSTAEAAECLAINEDTVKTRLHRAKGLLRQQIGGQLGPATNAVYAFHLSRCDRVVEGVMARILSFARQPQTDTR
jgi:RNA polymerase sigma-70 factor (ECF subfamily)